MIYAGYCNLVYGIVEGRDGEDICQSANHSCSLFLSALFRSLLKGSE